MDVISLGLSYHAFLAALALLILGLASVHVLKTRDNVSDAAAWLGLIWLVPVIGLLLYFLLGFNRIKRRAIRAREKMGLPPPIDGRLLSPITLPLDHASENWQAHARLGNNIMGQSLYDGNGVTMFTTGRSAFDAMIAAIETAQKTVLLSTYIFQQDQVGRRFLSALRQAMERGVQIRVIYDAVGNLYGWRPASKMLKKLGIPAAAFNPLRFGWKLAFFNLRTHRKILVVDGRHGFTGGMNLRRHHITGLRGKPPITDRHFSIEGPVISDLIEAFADDWHYATGRVLPNEFWPLKRPTAGSILCRAIPDGPDRKRPLTRTLIMSALSSAQREIFISTPYFLPDSGMRSALERAALRGVNVTILVPRHSNLPLFDLAFQSRLESLLDAGVGIWTSPPPFDHSKTMVVDGYWAMFGSSNWDARSLYLNFEFNVEAYGSDFALKMRTDFMSKLRDADAIEIETLKKQPVWARACGRLLWLLSPYL